MKERYKRVIDTYFSDYRTWFLALAVLFIAIFVIAIVFDRVNNFVWLIPVAYLIINLFSLPLLILYCKAKKDIKGGNIEKLTVRILEIQLDNNYTFKNRGGATTGKQKYRLIDENHNVYLLSASKEKDMFIISGSQLVFPLEVEVLKTSRLVVHMKLNYNPNTSNHTNEKWYNIKPFKKVFSHYF